MTIDKLIEFFDRLIRIEKSRELRHCQSFAQKQVTQILKELQELQEDFEIEKVKK